MAGNTGRRVRGGVDRVRHMVGRPVALDGDTAGSITVHTSRLLRLPDEDGKVRRYAAFVQDPRAAKALAEAG